MNADGSPTLRNQTALQVAWSAIEAELTDGDIINVRRKRKNNKTGRGTGKPLGRHDSCKGCE